MSRLDTLLGQVRDHESIPSEEDVNKSPSWSVQNFTFSLGVHSPFKAKQRPKVSIPQALPPLPFDGLLDSPLRQEYSFNWLTADDPGFYSPWSLGCGNSDALVSDTLAVKSPFNDLSGKYCPLDGLGPDLQQSSSSEVTHVISGGGMDLACPASDDRQAEGIRETCSENTGDGEWDGVLKLVQELTTQFTEPKVTDNNGAGNCEQKPDKIGEQQKQEGGDCAQAYQGLQDVSKNPGCTGSAEDILIVLFNIQRNIDKLIDVVPKLANHKPKLTFLVQKQCAAAAGAVRIISQLADAAVSIIPEVLRQLSAFASESCHSGNAKGRCNDDSPKSPNPPVSSKLREECGIGERSTMESLMPSLAAVSISPASLMSLRTLRDDANCANEGNTLALAGAPELESVSETECASSLVADLLGPCDRITGEDGFLPSANATSTSFRLHQWENDLEEAIKSEGAPLKSQASPFESPDDKSSSGGAGGILDEDPNPGVTSSAAAQDESDEGDARGADQLPLGSFTLMEIDDLEILTEQTHYCNICAKGFKRDANLRMHMRSHGGKYKSSTALVRSEKVPKVAQEMVGGKPTRYSCPYVGCSRNVKHPKFQALKTMLCLKNHYRRSHCAKTLKCSICKSKQFSVVADLKTHEKHCGSDKWACSCGTTFSRKEKLYGHVSLFVGHVPVDASTATCLASEVGQSAIPLQVKLTNDNDASATQNAALDIWQDW